MTKKQKQQKWNDGYYLEIVDRICILESNIEEHILKHPACEKHPEIRGKLEAAALLLADAYQDFGQYL